MSWTPEQAHKAEDAQKAHLLRLHTEGRYRDLCDDYCHEGWSYDTNDAGHFLDAGICSYRVTEDREAYALALVAAHIKAKILENVLGC